MAFYLSFMTIVSIFKPRLHGAVLGTCFVLGYGITLLAPLVCGLNPAFISLIVLSILCLCGLITARFLRYEYDEETEEYRMDDSLDSIRRLWEELDHQESAMPPALNPPPRNAGPSPELMPPVADITKQMEDQDDQKSE